MVRIGYFDGIYLRVSGITPFYESNNKYVVEGDLSTLEGMTILAKSTELIIYRFCEKVCPTNVSPAR
jgi:hypothetical protein